MPSEAASSPPPIFDPQTWVDLLTVYALKGDLMSVRTLTVLHEGVDKLDKAFAVPGSTLHRSGVHATLFERL
ncbi:MAG: hypothetical protein WDO13_04765 [Verrucomicrobiota bacterium]